jgi:hypothetical protein
MRWDASAQGEARRVPIGPKLAAAPSVTRHVFGRRSRGRRLPEALAPKASSAGAEGWHLRHRLSGGGQLSQGVPALLGQITRFFNARWVKS